MQSVPNFEKKHLTAGCPNCRSDQLYSMKKLNPTFGFTSKDELLVCRSCRLAIFVKELKKMLMSV